MIRLQPFTRADIPTLVEWSGSAEFLMQWAGPGFSYPLDEAQLEDLLHQAAAKNPTVMPFKAMDVDSEATVGHLELLGIDRRNRSATLGRVLIGPVEWRGCCPY
ncbi:MAG: hypothetical protein M1380_03790 [Chloroflexi bacterium]|nr:hypothetical protein [Chloroflexota bacterium]